MRKDLRKRFGIVDTFKAPKIEDDSGSPKEYTDHGAFNNEAKPSLPEGYKKGEARGMGAATKGGKYIIAPGE